MQWLVRGGLCLGVLGFCLYDYIDRHNGLTSLYLKIPYLEKELREIYEKNTQLQYRLDRQERPDHLLHLLERPEFGHLKPSSEEAMIYLPQGEAMVGDGSRAQGFSQTHSIER